MKGKTFFILAAALIAASCYPLVSNWYDTDYVNRKFEQPARARVSVAGSYESGLLSHRLIEFDKENGITSVEKASLAFGNTLAWFSDVRVNCQESLSSQRYLSCANQLLGRHFYYLPVQAVSDGWAEHYSDCDLNVYLLMDAMHLAGKEAEIVYAPHHAFIAYRNELTQQLEYWETTSPHNSGESADLRQDFYQKNPSNFYYTPYSAAYAESIYPALVIDKIPDIVRRTELLRELYNRFPDNLVVQDAWYEQKSTITREDAKVLVSLLMTDITSVSKRILLVNYLNSHQQEETAQMFLSQISDDDCRETCLKLKSQHAITYHFAQWGLQKLNTLGMSLSLSAFLWSVKEALIFDAFILLVFGTYKAFQRWPIIICRKRDLPEPQNQDNRAG